MKENRHQNIMSSVALKKGAEEPWTFERVAKFIDLLGCREITLKNDTEPAIIAFGNRVAEMCKEEVTTEDALKRDKKSNGLIENEVMLIRGMIRTFRAAHKNHSAMNRFFCRGWRNMQDASCPDVKRVVTGRCHLKDCMARSRHPDTISGFGLECKTTMQNVSLGMHMVYSELSKSQDWNCRADGTTKPSTM